MVVGLRYSLGILWLTLIVAETISSDTGMLHGDECKGIHAKVHIPFTHTRCGGNRCFSRPPRFTSGGKSSFSHRHSAGAPPGGETQFAKFAVQILERVMEA